MSDDRRLFNRDFALLWQGQLVSRVGSQAFLVAQMFWTMEATGSASLMGLLLMSSALPGVLLAPFAGTLADRHSRKAIIVGADLVRGVAVLGLAGLLLARPGEVGTVVGGLFAVAVLMGVVGALFNPTISAAIPDLVPADSLQAANSMNQLSGQGASFLGQVVGGVAFRLLGAPVLFLADGISYVLSAASEAFIRLPRVAERDVPAAERRTALGAPGGRGRYPTLRAYLADTAEGWRHVRDWPGMRTFVLTAAAVNFLFMPVFVLLPFYVGDVLDRSADWYGFLLASLSLGSLVGLVVAGAVRPRGRRRVPVLVGALLGATGCIALLGLVARAVPALAVTFGMGVCTSMINVYVLTLVQVATPARLRGRVLGLVIALTGAASPLGMAAGGVLADLTGRRVPATFVAAGLLATIAVVIAATRPAFRDFLATDASGTADSTRPGGEARSPSRSHTRAPSR